MTVGFAVVVVATVSIRIMQMSVAKSIWAPADHHLQPG